VPAPTWKKFFAGRIDDVRIYGRIALSAAEIQGDMMMPVNGARSPGRCANVSGAAIAIRFPRTTSTPRMRSTSTRSDRLPPAHGSLQIQAGGGSVLYTHDGGETTSDSFTYTIRDAANAPSNEATVSVTVTPANDPPLAENDSAQVVEGSSVLIGLTANDSDPEGALNPG
jgi:VCBS repeat-containing protein